MDLILKHISGTETVKLRLDELIRRDRLFILTADEVEEMSRLQLEYYSSIRINPIRFRLCWSEDADAELDYRHTAAQCLAAVEPIKDIKTFRRLLDFYCGISSESLRKEASKAFIARQDISDRIDDLRADYSDSEIIGDLISSSEQAAELPATNHAAPTKGITVHRHKKLSGKDDAERDAFAKRLGEPKDFAGPWTVDGVDELFSALYDESPWLNEPIKHVWSEARNNAAYGEPFAFSPVLMFGGPGLGKSHMATSLARLSGCPIVHLNGGNMTSAFDIAGVEKAWRSASPGVCVRAIHDHGIANPVVIVDEIDKTPRGSSGGDPQLALLPFLQSDTAEGYRCPYVQGVVDLSFVNWLACANDISSIPRPLLDRFAVFEIHPPTGEVLMHFLERRFSGLDFPSDKMVELKRAVEKGRISIRGALKLEERIRAYDARPLLN